MDCSNKCSSNKHLEKPQNRIIQKITQITESYVISVEMTKGLFTWREGAPANRVTRLEGMKHSLPLHAEFTALLFYFDVQALRACLHGRWVPRLTELPG